MAGCFGKYFTSENERGAKSAKQISALIYVPGVEKHRCGIQVWAFWIQVILFFHVLKVKHKLWGSVYVSPWRLHVSSQRYKTSSLIQSRPHRRVYDGEIPAGTKSISYILDTDMKHPMRCDPFKTWIISMHMWHNVLKAPIYFPAPSFFFSFHGGNCSCSLHQRQRENFNTLLAQQV